MSKEARRGAPIKTTLTKSSELELQVARAKEQELWLQVRDQWPKYRNLKIKQKVSGSLPSAEAALIATFEGYANYMLLAANAKDRNLEESGIKRIQAFSRQIAYLQASGLFNPVPNNSRVLLLGAGGIITDAYPFAHRITQLNAKRLAEYDIQGAEAVTVNPKTGQPNFAGAIALLNKFSEQGIVTTESTNCQFTAVEPDSFQLKTGATICPEFGIHPNYATTTAENFLQQDTGPGYDLIAAIRTEPRLILGETDEFVEMLASRLNPNGQILFSVGGGNSREEKAQRFEMLADIVQSWGRIGTANGQINDQSAGCEQWNSGTYMDLAAIVLKKG